MLLNRCKLSVQHCHLELPSPKAGLGTVTTWFSKKENQTTLDFSSRWKCLLFGLYYLCWKRSVFLQLSPWKQFSLCSNNNGSLVIWYSKQTFLYSRFQVKIPQGRESHTRCVENRSWKWVFQAAFCLDHLLLSHNPIQPPSPSTDS